MGTRRAGMLSVGEVARRCGLTGKALRHYDSLGLLVPAVVSGVGYRWYGADQVETRSLLTAHRAVLQARDDRIRRALHSLDHLLNDPRGTTMALDEAAAPAVTDERKLAAQLFNDTWGLLEKEHRTPEEDDRMVHMAHASRFHWDNAGDDQNRAIGEWQVARVYSALGLGESALFHARRCLHYASRPGLDDWLPASAHEGLARAFAAAGDTESARDSRDTALALLDNVADPEDRKVVADDIDTLPVS